MLAIAQANEHDSDLDRGATSPGTERHCALSRELKPTAEMIRFVVGPAGEVVPDVKRKLPGRGIWITGTRDALQEAVKRNVFARGFKRDVRLAGDLAADSERLLERAALDALAIAAKAGQLVFGFAKVESAIGGGRHYRADSRRRCGGRRKAQAGCGLAAQQSRKTARNRGRRPFYRRPIGFGIKPPKCGTCSPACRPRERDFSRSRCAFDALSDRKFDPCG